MPFLIVLLTLVLAVLWIVGEASNQPWLRRIAGPREKTDCVCFTGSAILMAKDNLAVEAASASFLERGFRTIRM